MRTGLQSAWRRTYDPDAEIDWLSVRYNAAIGGMLGSANEGVKMAARWMARNGNRKSDGGQTKMPWTFSPDSKKTDPFDVRDQNQLLGNPGNAVPYYELDPHMPYSENANNAGKGSIWIGDPSDDVISFSIQDYFANNSQGNRNGKTGWLGRLEDGSSPYLQGNLGNSER